MNSRKKHSPDAGGPTERQRHAGAILKPQVDTKGGGELVSRLGVHRKADRLIRPDMDVFEVVREASQATKLACVLCDESQFFTAEQAEQLFMVTVDLNIPVICYGLRARNFSLAGASPAPPACWSWPTPSKR